MRDTGRPQKVWQRQTQLLQTEQDEREQFRSLSSAVERASTVIFPDVAALRQRDWRDDDQYAYGLSGTPTSRRLARRIALLEGGDHCLLLPSGLAAISLTMLSLLKSGERLLLPENAYEPAIDFARFLQSQYAVAVDFYDPLDLDSVRFTPATRLLWVETPGSVSMEMADLPALCRLAKTHDALVAVDATWAASIAMRPLELGADISIQALTKYQSGGSDVLLGSIASRDRQLHQRLKLTHMQSGTGVSPEDCNLVLRSLPHYKLRYLAQDAAARKIAGWLQQQAAVAAVLHPALPDSPGHDIWRRDCSAAASLFSIVFRPHIPQPAIDRFVDQLQLFHIGFSWGGSHSLALPFDMRKIRSSWPYAGGLVRLYIGLEDADDLIADLEQALTFLQT